MVTFFSLSLHLVFLFLFSFGYRYVFLFMSLFSLCLCVFQIDEELILQQQSAYGTKFEDIPCSSEDRSDTRNSLAVQFMSNATSSDSLPSIDSAVVSSALAELDTITSSSSSLLDKEQKKEQRRQRRKRAMVRFFLLVSFHWCMIPVDISGAFLNIKVSDSDRMKRVFKM